MKDPTNAEIVRLLQLVREELSRLSEQHAELSRQLAKLERAQRDGA